MADDAEARGLDVAPMPEAAQAAMKQRLPFCAPRNPVDVTAQSFNDIGVISEFLAKMVKEGEYDSLLCFWTSVAGSAALKDKLLKAMRDGIAGAEGVLTVQCLIAPPEIRKAYEDDGYPCFEDPSRAVAAIDAMTRAGMAIAAGRPETPAIPEAAPLPAGDLTEAVAADLLAEAGLPMLRARLAGSAEEAAELAAGAGGPVALKIASPDIAHKTDIGGVALGVAPEAAGAEFDAMIARAAAAMPEARIDGALVAPMVPDGVDLILGAKQDPAFGPVVMVGLGGVLTEVFRDVAFRRAPVSEATAHEMLAELKGHPLLRGARGAAMADVDAVARAVSALSVFAAAHAADVESVEINPLRALPEGRGALGLDALIERRAPPQD